MSFQDILRLRQLDLAGRRVFLRADLDLPLSPRRRLLSDAALLQLGPTLTALSRQGCKVVIAGHAQQLLVLSAVAEGLSALLGQPVSRLGADFAQRVSTLQEGQIALAPSLDGFAEERANDALWSANVARVFDVY